MDFKKLQQKAVEVKKKYAEIEKKTLGREWTKEELMSGFVGDVGMLTKLTMAKAGLRQDIQNVDEKIAHELSDCLYSVLVLADKYNVDLESMFLETMKELEKRIADGHYGK